MRLFLTHALTLVPDLGHFGGADSMQCCMGTFGVLMLILFQSATSWPGRKISNFQMHLLQV